VKVSLRQATDADLPLILAWRNNPLVYSGFYTQGKSDHQILWEEHVSWWRSRFNWKVFLIQVTDEGLGIRPVGVVGFAQLDHWSPEIGYYIGEVSLWRKGVAKEGIRQGLEWLKSQGFPACQTTVLEHNEASLHILQSFGFKVVSEAREGELFVLKVF